ncbi:hypothetical protein N7532_009934 [Penicillium argentinense]|uniref:Phytanoyl-CoA dioxygenase n=1 Tax=Penicillium argentinense TaxID=1131581 RepID=A0A9W9ENM5_9EURO|nr:uncharacterized protein N7532_009934 [Penicillium argentinense]KAJ5085163.1 hypothetical protein N7532_009934 [Penicillium argentinense]
MTIQAESPKIVKLDAHNPKTKTDGVTEIVQRDGGVIIKGLFPTEHTERIRAELKPVFDADIPDPSGFFPKSTRRATGLIGISDACVEYVTNKLWIDVCNKILSMTKSTYENVATLIIPGSHKWDIERTPKREEAVPAELDVGDVLIFTGNVYHGGGANKSIDQIREVIGMFMVKGMYRPAENQMLAVPPEKARSFPPGSKTSWVWDQSAEC